MTRMLNLESNKDEDDDSFAKRVKASFDYSVRSYVQSSNEEKLERAAGMKGSLKEYGVAYSKEFGSKFDVVDVVLAILDRHKLIKHWFTSEAWKSLNKYESDILLKVVKLRVRIKNQLRKLFPYAALSVGPGTVMRPRGSEALLPCMLCGKIPPLKLFPTTL